MIFRLSLLIALWILPGLSSAEVIQSEEWARKDGSLAMKLGATPAVDAQFNLGDMYMIGRGAGDDHGAVQWLRKQIATDEPRFPSPPPPLLPQRDDARERLIWSTIKDRENPEDFESYLRRYPIGIFAGLARNRLEALKPRQRVVFRDCATCPAMVVLSGEFMMGSPANEEGRYIDEGPRHLVSVGFFGIGRFEVTFAEWDACVADDGCRGYLPADNGRGRGERPVINVNWRDAKAYAAWLSRTTGRAYRLPSEAEWEYAARAGTTTPFHFGATISTDQANINGTATYGNGRTSGWLRELVPVGSFMPNAFLLHDVHGNVSEWVEDCYRDSFDGAPGDARVWLAGEDCERRVVRGGSGNDYPAGARAADRNKNVPQHRDRWIGFRIAIGFPRNQ